MSVHEQQRQLRQKLVAQGIRDTRVLDAIETTRRDLFVPDGLRDFAYDNVALPIGNAQTISQPYIVALMTEALRLNGDENVLEIGTGSGYQTAVLSSLCGRLVTIERLTGLAQPAEKLLRKLGYRNIEFRVGDGTLGCPEFAPYDGIIVTAAAPQIPPPLFDQLEPDGQLEPDDQLEPDGRIKPGGRLVVPVGSESLQRLELIEQIHSTRRTRKLCDCRFVKLIGAAGWTEPQKAERG